MFCFCTFPLSNFNVSIFILVLRLLLFICKRTSVLGVCDLFTNDCGPSLPVLYTKAAVLITRFVYKGLRSLSFAIHLQRTAVLVFRYSFAEDCCPCRSLFICKRPLSLSFCYSFAKDCCPCLVLFTCKGLRPCLLLFICKGLLSLSSAIYLQRTASLSSAIHLQKTAVLV